VVVHQAIKGDLLMNRLVAVVDLGSNSFHLIIAELREHQFRIIERVRAAVRLGAGLDAQGCLTANVQQRAFDCLHHFHERLDALQVKEVYALGTNTLRVAANTSVFLQQAEKILGHSIRVISGLEEAELIFYGANYEQATTTRELIIDIGGGSTELIIGYQNQPEILHSVAMGCVSFNVEFFANKKESKAGSKDINSIFSQIHQRVDQLLQPIAHQYRESGWETAIGCSGTIQAVAHVAEANGWAQQQEITPEVLEKIREYLVSQGPKGLRNLAGLRADRQSIFPAGVAILSALFSILQIDKLTLSTGALREGMLYRILQLNQDIDVVL